MIRQILLPQNSDYSGLRFDIHVIGGRVFSLLAENESQCKEWTRALSKLLGNNRLETVLYC
jgi:hypothetical protein